MANDLFPTGYMEGNASTYLTRHICASLSSRILRLAVMELTAFLFSLFVWSQHASTLAEEEEKYMYIYIIFIDVRLVLQIWGFL